MEQTGTVTEKLFDTGEVAINYAEGPNAGPPMVLLHGATRWWHDWDAVMEAMQSDWHFYACDLRGHGKSGRDGDHYLLTDYVRDIVTFLDFQVDEPVVLVGHSLGALTALGVAAQAPDRIKALVLLDPPLFVRNSSLDVLPYVKMWLNMVLDLKKSAPSFEALLDKVRSIADTNDEAEIRARAEVIYRLAPEAVESHLREELVDGFDMAAEMQRITCPTLFLQADGNAGGAMRDEDAEFARAHIQNATVIKLPNASHSLPDAHTADVVRLMQSFLQTH